MQPSSGQTARYPIYIPSKGRWDRCFTALAFRKIGVDCRVVVEEDEAKRYEEVLGIASLIVIPQHNRGLVVTRNCIWDHATVSGAERYWTFDDNIRAFYRFNCNRKRPIGSGAFLRIIEDFIDRYANVLVAGMQYELFVPHRKRIKNPFALNTRVYSNMLVATDAKDRGGKPYRFEGYYNDDTDLCLRILKDRYCTILFNAFLADKITTMTIKGGNTPHYQGDGRWRMAEELRRKHPDVTTIVKRWGRWQHKVDYRPFKRNRLIKKAGVKVAEGVDNHGMVLRKVATDG